MDYRGKDAAIEGLKEMARNLGVIAAKLEKINIGEFVLFETGGTLEMGILMGFDKTPFGYGPRLANRAGATSKEMYSLGGVMSTIEPSTNIVSVDDADKVLQRYGFSMQSYETLIEKKLGRVAAATIQT